jgi:hypothetical protein
LCPMEVLTLPPQHRPRQSIRDGVDRYGIDKESAENWIESISSRPEVKSDFAISPGTSTGLKVTYDLRYDGSKGIQAIIVHVNPA